jgi:hypothetical protein
VNDNLRELQLRLLEDAAAADPRSQDFDEFLNAVKLSSLHRDELVRVLIERRWRRSSQPFEYVRRRVLASAVRSDIWREENLTSVVVAPRCDFSDAISELDSRFEYDDDDEDILWRKVRPEYRLTNTTGDFDVRWDLVQRALQLSRLERKALRLMLEGVELDEAIAREKRTSSRAALVKAWSSLGRRLPELRAELFVS